jgi:hypothetical protein
MKVRFLPHSVFERLLRDGFYALAGKRQTAKSFFQVRRESHGRDSGLLPADDKIEKHAAAEVGALLTHPGALA